MRFFLLLLAAITVVTSKKRFQGLPNRPGLQGLINKIVGPDKVRATCDVIFMPQKASFSDAKAACKALRIAGQNTDLVTLDAKVKNAQLMLLHDAAYPLNNVDESGDTKASWSGLERVNNKGIKYKAKKMQKKKQVKKAYKVSDWEWISNGQSPNDFAEWFDTKKNAQPNNEYMKSNKAGKKLGCKTNGGCFQDAVVVDQNAGKWDDAFEFEQHPYACDYKGKYILSPELKKWDSAKKSCEKAGLVLATVRNADDVRELKEAFEFFLGPVTSEDKWDASNWLWVGGTDEANEGVWRWTDGSLVDWDLPWIPKHGNDNKDRKGEGQHALSMNRDGKFDDSYGDWSKKTRGFACECA